MKVTTLNLTPELALVLSPKYDRSDRSTGVAVITYSNASEATAAQEQLGGVLAMGDSAPI
jgi:hypothetical protein